jgi:hypothetical protein
MKHHGWGGVSTYTLGRQEFCVDREIIWETTVVGKGLVHDNQISMVSLETNKDMIHIQPLVAIITILNYMIMTMPLLNFAKQIDLDKSFSILKGGITP